MVVLLEVVGTTVVWGVIVGLDVFLEGVGVGPKPENGQGTNTNRGRKEESKTNHLNNKVMLRNFTTVYNSVFLMLQTQTNRKKTQTLRMTINQHLS